MTRQGNSKTGRCATNPDPQQTRMSALYRVPQSKAVPNLEEWKAKLMGKHLVALRVQIKDDKKEYKEWEIGKAGVAYIIVTRGMVVKDSIPYRLQVFVDQYRVVEDVKIG